MKIRDDAMAYLQMQVYAYQSQLSRTAVWVAKNGQRKTVFVEDVIEAAKVLNDSEVLPPDLNLKGFCE